MHVTTVGESVERSHPEGELPGTRPECASPYRQSF